MILLMYVVRNQGGAAMVCETPVLGKLGTINGNNTGQPA